MHVDYCTTWKSDFCKLRAVESCYVLYIDLSVDNCMGSWSTGCIGDGNNCTYKATWMVLGDVHKVFFAVKAHTTGWVGIGFSDNNMMVSH